MKKIGIAVLVSFVAGFLVYRAFVPRPTSHEEACAGIRAGSAHAESLEAYTKTREKAEMVIAYRQKLDTARALHGGADQIDALLGVDNRSDEKWRKTTAMLNKAIVEYNQAASDYNTLIVKTGRVFTTSDCLPAGVTQALPVELSLIEVE